MVFVLLGWVLGAHVEEIACRGYLLTRIRDAFGQGRAGAVVAIVASSVLFGITHTEQGLVGMVVVTFQPDGAGCDGSWPGLSGPETNGSAVGLEAAGAWTGQPALPGLLVRQPSRDAGPPGPDAIVERFEERVSG